MRAVVAGSFDPVTLGHVDIITRAARLFDHVIVGVGLNSGKDYLFDLAERERLVREACAGMVNVRVAAIPGLLVDFCKAHGATTVVRGARSGGDFDAEWAMATMNASLGDVETIILPARPAVGFISSSLVRAIVRAGGSVTAYVPPVVAARLEKEW